MPLGKVQINNLNLGQGDVTEVERHFLFIGRAGHADEESQLFSVNAQTELETLLADSNLRKQVIAAQLNAGQNWSAAVYPLAADETLAEAIDAANEVQSFEAVVVCDVQTTQQALQDIQAEVISLQATLGRWCFAMVAVPGIDPVTQTWPQYEATMADLQDGLACNLVLPVPQLFGNNLGMLAGRLCNRSVSIADTPMRVATGPVLGSYTLPVDVTDTPLSLATLNTLAEARFSVPQWYPDFEGLYWGDGSMLEAEGGDYQYVEYVRAVHKASRQVRVLSIQRIGNRRLNSTPASIESNKSYFMRPLRDMSKSFEINGEIFPGDIQAPVEGDITITWMTNSKVNIGMVVRPYKCPKAIEVNIMLDLSQ